MLPRRLFSWLFVLALLLGQAAAFAHALGHLHRDDGGSAEPVCELCVAHAQLGHAVPPAAALPLPPAATFAAPATTSILAVGTLRHHAQARAPPVSV